MSGATLRLDKLLWFLRLAKTRSLAQHAALAGHIRVNGRRAERPAHPVAVGDMLTVPTGTRVRVIELLALPRRRGPALEAQACYRTLDGALDEVGDFAIAAPDSRGAAQKATEP
ncbi:MAG TPA: RNA-binding S4 domain-containing protein [Novosphingobium sp.]|nr:RNA-binding S4 domain-containing protein [Novosphingobium sp.]